LGSVVSGVFSRINPTIPVYILAGVVFLTLVWGYFTMAESLSQARRTPKLKLQQLSPLTRLYRALKVPHLRWLLLSYLFTWMTVMVTSTNLPSLVTDRLKWSSDEVSMLFALYGVLNMIVLAAGLPLLLRVVKEVHLAITGAILAGLAFLGLGILSVTGSVVTLYSSIVLFSIGQPICETALCGTISKSVSVNEQGGIQGSINAIQALAQMLGPLSAGWLYEAVSPAMPYWVGGGQMILGGLLVLMAIPILQISEQQSSKVTDETGDIL
jgi:MFS transporter, DHA1 family, tetracycline resistance protein